MKSLCYIAISMMIFGYSSGTHAQAWKDKLKDQVGGQKKGQECAPDLTEERTMELLGGLQPDDGIYNPFHQAHVGKVVFTSKEMEPQTITDSDVKTKFGINEGIYFTFFMPKSFRNQVIYPLDETGFNQEYCYDHSFHKWYHGDKYAGMQEAGTPAINGYGAHLIYVEIDGVQITDIIFFIRVNFNSTKTAFTGYISPDPSITAPTDAWIGHMANLTEGDHTVKVEVAGYEKKTESDQRMTKDVVAAGEFTLTKGAGESFAPKMGKSWSNYKSGMNNSSLEAKVLKAVQDYGRRNSYAEKFVKIKISSTDWTITRTKTVHPVITGRYIVAYCYAKYDNGQCKVQRYSFRQEYDGSGYQSTVSCRGVFRNDYPQAIDCD